MATSTDRPYIFISYAHADSALVLPTVRAMQAAGIDLWYDEGIEAGSEWPEYIAEKVMHCSKFLLFISNAYLASQNCKRELNFAISRKKDILSVHLETVQLSPGMEMQLGTYQAIFRSRFADDAAFHHALAEEHFFDSCIPGGRKATVTPPAAPTPPVNTPPAYAPQQSYAQQPYAPQDQGYQRPQPNPMYRQPQGQQPYQQPTQPTQPAYRPQQPTYQQPTPQQPQYQPPAYQPQPTYQPNYSLPKKNRFLAAVLALFCGFLGVHKLYLGKKKTFVAYLIFFFVCAGIGISAPLPILLGFFDSLMLFIMSNQTFERKYHCRTK